MKCKHCNGTGKIRGYFYEKTGVNKWEKVWGDSPCDECNGTGEIEITNEEWFCQLPTEEKAEFLAKKCCEISCKFFLGEAEEIFSKYWVEWLKQPHKPFS